MMLQFCALLVFHILAWYIVVIIPLHYKHQAKVAPTANCSYMAEMIALVTASALFISIVWFSFLILCVFCSSWHGWYVANKLVTSFSAVTKHYEVAFGLIYGRNESTREDTSSTDMIGADFDCCRWTLSTENHESTAPEPYSQGG